ncbi:hypothetical protein QBC47DRAFT_80298 [Echria macrotheca]|uniref:ER transporter 6TM N-terminal domain-containing protein n=1 Tax=Echria macrotheca TaxID=438768 RepID=A0AAJ0B491_9PEZI|nr:hypothetical protein QBC47DRAFT_80298 [Echria macrotheca]
MATAGQDRDSNRRSRTEDEGEGAGDAHDDGPEGPADHNDHEDAPPAPAKKPNVFSKLVTKLGLDKPTLLMMFKGSLPPTIGIAMCQAPVVASYFATLGYLIPIITVLSLAILPRGKFLMNLLLSLLAVCFGAAISMLALWSSVQARAHTASSTEQTINSVTYNSSQSAVCAVWLFANIWFGNVVRAKLPSFNLPIIMYSILVNISATFGPFLTTTAAAAAFIKQLLTAMLTALALALCVSILVFPVSSRLVVFKEFTGAIGLLRKTVALQKAYLIRLESDDMFAVATRTDTSPGFREGSKETKPLTKEAKAAKALKEITDKMAELSGKMHADITFAKRDVAWGKLDAKDISELFALIRNVYIPIMGMTTIIDIFKRVSEHRGWVGSEDELPEVMSEKEREKRVWNEVMKRMHEPFHILSEAVDGALEHAGLCLELLPRAKQHGKAVGKAAGADVEAQGEQIKPGEPGFARIVDELVEKFRSRKGELLKTWARETALMTEEEEVDGVRWKFSGEKREREKAQLYVVLYMENLMHASGRAVQELVAFADAKVADGTMSKKRLIVPGFRRLRKWIMAILSNEDSSAEQAPDLMESSPNIVYSGDSYNKKRDPEHLPPATPWEHFGTRLRKVSDFFGSEESMFGLRAACATMTIGIIAFLENTQRFFMEQRLVWALIIIAIGMSMTSGQSFFGFLCRVGGTVVAMVFSLIIWYIVDERRPGAIVFLWLFVFIDYYFFIKYPRFIPAIMITIVTQVLIIGYELQVLTIGKEVAERTGQPYYATYLLAPYRLACVAGGSVVAFFWTVFPKPLTDRTWLRRDLAATLYLMANYFGVINSTIQSSMNAKTGDLTVPGTPAYQLYKAGRKIFGKVMLLLPSMSQHSYWQRWEPTIGGKFPREAYDEIIMRSTRIMGYLTLISYTLTHPTPTQSNDASDEKASPESGEETGGPAEDGREAWRDSLARVLQILKPTHHAILSTLTLLSNSLLSGQSLPPFVPLPRPYEMTRRLMWLNYRHGSDSEDDSNRSIDSQELERRNLRATGSPSTPSQSAAHINILHPKNMDQPGYAEFAVLQVCTTLVCDDLEGLAKAVSGLVGVVDFSFRIDSSESTSETSFGVSGKDSSKGKVD